MPVFGWRAAVAAACGGKRGLTALAMTLLLSGCSPMLVQLRAFDEPPENTERARLRVVANGWVRAVPNARCLAPLPEGSGTVFGLPRALGSSGFRGRSLGLPGPSSHRYAESADFAEFHVAAGEPIILHMRAEATRLTRACGLSISFVPEAGQDYEARMLARLNTCEAQVKSLTHPGQPVASRELNARTPCL